MKSCLLLLKLNLSSFFSGMRPDALRKDNGKLDISRMLLYAVAGLSILSLAVLLVFAEYWLYKAAATIRMENLLMGAAVLLSMVMTLIFSAIHSTVSLYFNRDIQAFAWLPISSRVIMTARWLEIYLMELFTELIIALPLVIIHGVAKSLGVMYYLRSILVVAALPLLPLAITLLLGSILGRLTTFVRHREAWITIGTILMVALVLTLEFTLLPTIPEDADAMFFLKLMMNNAALMDLLLGSFPPVMWALNGIMTSWGSALLFVTVSAAVIAALLYLLGGNYMNVCLQHSEQTTRVRRSKRSRAGREVKTRSPLMALYNRELNEIIKTPVYLLNGGVGVMMMPIMLMGAYFGATADGSDFNISALLGDVIGKIAATDLMLILTGILLLGCWMCPVASTAVSREGQRLPISRMIPVDPALMLVAKLMSQLTFVLPATVLIAAVMLLFIGVNYWPVMLGALVLFGVMVVPVSIFNLVVDVLRPVLNWRNENEAMKQNMNSFFGMLASTALMLLAALPAFLLLDAAPWVRLTAVCAVAVAELLLSLVVFRRVAVKRYAALEP